MSIPHQVVGPFPENSVQPPAEFRGPDFPAVPLAHRGEFGGVIEPPLEEVGLVPLFQFPGGEVLPADPQDIHEPRIEAPLVLQVVQGEE